MKEEVIHPIPPHAFHDSCLLVGMPHCRGKHEGDEDMKEEVTPFRFGLIFFMISCLLVGILTAAQKEAASHFELDAA